MWSGGKLYSSDEGSLNLTGTETFSGTDTMGAFKATELTWSAEAGGSASLITQFKLYDSYIVFEQRIGAKIENASCGNHDGVATVFPSFKVEADKNGKRRGFMQSTGQMVGETTEAFEWGTKAIPGGAMNTGPLILFSQDLSTTSVISPAYNMMAANQYYDPKQNLLMYGVMGTIEKLPVGFTVQTILTLSDNGINRAMMEWGDVLLQKYGKDRSGPENDMTLNYLGYSTDNGAFYYYFTEHGKNYEDTMIDVKAYADSVGIPYRHWLADSWWYYKGDQGGVKNWTAMSSIFPHGLDYVYNKTGWPVVGHNRYWSANTDYAKQNGGQYDFYIDKESEYAVPLTQDFWDMLMETSKKWGLYTYEQDWLHNEFDTIDAMRTNATLARTWLMQMGAGAKKNGLTIQYCMSYPRHILQSVEIPAVTQARASDDYGGGRDQWKPLGTTSMFAWALGIAPSKDSFWSTQNLAHADRGGYKGNIGEPYNRLQSAVLTMSRGPVTTSDENGKSDVPLIMRSCMKDGTLLQLHQPAFALDVQFVQKAFGSGGPVGQVWSGFSRVAGVTYSILFSAVLSGSYAVGLKVLSQGFGAEFDYANALSNQTFVAYEANKTDTLFEVSASLPLRLTPKEEGKADSRWDFTFHSIAPVYSNGWALLGEPDKWIAVSEERFTDVTELPTALVVNLRGTPGEIVNVAFKVPGSMAPKVVSCVVPQSGTAKLKSSIGKCTAWLDEESLSEILL